MNLCLNKPQKVKKSLKKKEKSYRYMPGLNPWLSDMQATTLPRCHRMRIQRYRVQVQGEATYFFCFPSFFVCDEMFADMKVKSFFFIRDHFNNKKKLEKNWSSPVLEPGTFGSTGGGTLVTSPPANPKVEGRNLRCSGIFFLLRIVIVRFYCIYLKLQLRTIGT